MGVVFVYKTSRAITLLFLIVIVLVSSCCSVVSSIGENYLPERSAVIGKNEQLGVSNSLPFGSEALMSVKYSYCVNGSMVLYIPMLLPLHGSTVEGETIRGINLTYFYAINDMLERTNLTSILPKDHACYNKPVQVVGRLKDTNNSSTLTYVEVLELFQRPSFLGFVGPHSVDDMRVVSVAGDALSFPTVSFSVGDSLLEPIAGDYSSLFTTCSTVQDYARVMGKLCAFFQWGDVVLIQDYGMEISSNLVDAADSTNGGKYDLNLRESLKLYNGVDKLLKHVNRQRIFLYPGTNHSWVKELTHDQRKECFNANNTWIATSSFKDFLHNEKVATTGSLIVIEEVFESSKWGDGLASFLVSENVDSLENHLFTHVYDSVASYFFAIEKYLTEGGKLDELSPKVMQSVLPKVSFEGAGGHFTFAGSDSSFGLHMQNKFKLANFLADSKAEGEYRSVDVAFIHEVSDPDNGPYIKLSPVDGSHSEIVWNSGLSSNSSVFSKGPFLAKDIYSYSSIPKTFFCDSGCHHGQCVAENTCRCESGWTGPACELDQYIGWDNSAALAIIICSGTLAVVLAVAFILLIVNINHKAMRRASPPFFFLMYVGIFGLCFSWAFVTGELTDVQCAGLPWLLTISFGLISSNVLTKIWRIHKVFHSGTITRNMKLSDGHLFSYAWKFWAFQLTLLILWTVLDPMKRGTISSDQFTTYYACDASHSTESLIFALLLVCSDFILLVVSCYFAFRCRDVSNLLSESKPLSVSSYCIAFVLVMYVVISQTVSYGALSGFLILTICSFILAFSLAFIMILPKLYYVFDCHNHPFFSSHYSSTNKDENGTSCGDELSDSRYRRGTNIQPMYSSRINTFPYSSSYMHACTQYTQHGTTVPRSSIAVNPTSTFPSRKESPPVDEVSENSIEDESEESALR
eukprot:Nk52_evm9s307 gene=Nk52_evmTU9s307